MRGVAWRGRLVKGDGERARMKEGNEMAGKKGKAERETGRKMDKRKTEVN